MISKNTLFAWLILLLAACKADNKKKEVIVGMDEELDTIQVNQLSYAKTDSLIKDTSAKRNVLDHDAFLREHKKTVPGIPVFKGSSSFRMFIVELKHLVAANNKQEIAKLIKYPLNTSIKNLNDFYANYDKLFTTAVRKSLSATNVDRLPRTQQTIMIADGKILISRQGNEYRIIRINN